MVVRPHAGFGVRRGSAKVPVLAELADSVDDSPVLVAATGPVVDGEGEGGQQGHEEGGDAETCHLGYLVVSLGEGGP